MICTHIYEIYEIGTRGIHTQKKSKIPNIRPTSFNIRTNVAKIPILLASHAYSGLNQYRVSNFKHCLSMPDIAGDLL